MKTMSGLAASKFLALVSVATIATAATWPHLALGQGACTKKCIGITCLFSALEGGNSGCLHYSQTQAVITISLTGSETEVLLQSGDNTITQEEAASCNADCNPLVNSFTGTASDCAIPYENPTYVSLQTCVAPTSPTGP